MPHAVACRARERVSGAAARRSSLLWVVAPLFVWAAAPPDPDLVRVYYDFEVAGYCGLVSEQVGSGFARERDRLLSGRGIDEQAKQQARMQGWKEANLEWQNRGLGGFRGWCRTEGADAARRFAGAVD